MKTSFYLILIFFMGCSSQVSMVSSEKGYARAKRQFEKSSKSELRDLQEISFSQEHEPIFSVYSELGYRPEVSIPLNNSNNSWQNPQNSKRDTASSKTLLYIFGGKREEPIKRIESIKCKFIKLNTD